MVLDFKIFKHLKDLNDINVIEYPLKDVGKNPVVVYCDDDLQTKVMCLNEGDSTNPIGPDVLDIQHIATGPNLKGKSYIK